MKKRKLEDIVIVVRSCGERTVPRLLKDLYRMLPMCEVNLVEKSPFYEALLEHFDISRKSSAKFTFGLDGDIILYEQAPELILNCIQNFDTENIIRQHFKVHDKFLGILDAGNQLFNNRFAEEFYQYLKNKGDKSCWRPESDNLFKFSDMKGLKRDLETPDKFIGLHEHEQYYRNVFQSMKNRAIKYLRDKNQRLNELEGLVAENKDDMDYIVALEGFRAGMEESELVLDKDRYTDISTLLKNLNITEKSAL